MWRRGEPFVTEIGVGKVIKGWDEGMLAIHLSRRFADHRARCPPVISRSEGCPYRHRRLRAFILLSCHRTHRTYNFPRHMARVVSPQ